MLLSSALSENLASDFVGAAGLSSCVASMISIHNQVTCLHAKQGLSNMNIPDIQHTNDLDQLLQSPTLQSTCLQLALAL